MPTMGGRHKLCRKCHGRISVEGAAEDPTMAELDAMIAEQLPTMPANDEEEPPVANPDAWWSRKRKDTGPRPGDLWEQWAGIDHSRVGCEFHPDTEPAAQREAVREAVALEPGATVERLSELCVLPAWNVTRALEAIRTK